MGAAETIAGLTGFERRGAGTDGERRAALWLSRELRGGGREVTVETFWCRPNWALAHAWHALLALAGSLVSVSSPRVGGALVLVALVSLILDGLTGVSLGRRLTPERASQNVVARAPARQRPVRLILTANYDAGRTGLAHRGPPRRLAAWLGRLAGGRGPGWLGWLAIACLWLLATAVLRAGGAGGTALGIAQLIPTAGLVVGLALLLDLAGSEFGPGAGDNASGVAVALALARGLDVSPPHRLSVEVILQGAGDGAMTGLGRHLRARRRELAPSDTIVLAIAPCGAGRPRWWVSDGPLIPLRYPRRLAGVSERAAGPGTEIAAAPHRGRGSTPALPARLAGLPAIAIGALDERGLVPRSRQAGDRPEALDQGSIDRMLEFALTLVDAIDADLKPAAALPASPVTYRAA